MHTLRLERLAGFLIGWMLLAYHASADQTLLCYQNRTDGGYPYAGALDDYVATLSVQDGVQTYMPAGQYTATCRTFVLGENGWAEPFLPDVSIGYTVDASGKTTNSGQGQRNVFWDWNVWWAAGNSKVQLRSIFLDANNQEHSKVLTTITQGDRLIRGTPDFAGSAAVLASVQHYKESFKLTPSVGCGCNCQSGTCTAGLDSIDFTVKLGQNNFGDNQGSLAISSDVPASYLSTPTGLVDLIDDPSSCDVVYRNYVLRQVLCAQSLVDVQPVNAYKYQINFYQRLSGDPKDGSGIYQCGGTPFKTITVENPDASATIYNRLLITESGGGAPDKTTEYDWSATDQRWDMITGSGLRRESLVTVTDAATGDLIKTRSVSNPAGTVVTKKVQRFHTYSWAPEMISETLDPDGAALTTTWSYFDNGDTTPGAWVGKLKQMVAPTGRWERYEYANGAETKHVTSFLDAPLGSPDNQCRVVTTTYASVNPVQTIVETLQGVEISRRYLAGTPDGQQQEIVCQQAGAAWNAPGNLMTTRSYDASGELLREQRPDGTLTLGSYTVSGGQKTTSLAVGAPNTAGTDIADGAATTTVVDQSGNQLLQIVTDVASGLTLSSATTVQTDPFGRPTQVLAADGSSELTNYGCCGVASRTDRDGNTVSYTYDALSRVASEAQAGITTLYSYDADGRRLSTVRQGSDNSQITTELLTYDLAGRQTSHTDALGNVTASSVTIDPATGHTASTTTLPDDAHSTRIETSFQDSSLLSVGGTAAHPLLYAYGADPTAGAWRQEIRVGDQGAATEWTMTYTDAAGRDYKTLTAAGAVTQSFFNAQGQLSRSVDPDGVTTLYGYNARGEQDTVALDMDRNGQINFAGNDRITRTIRAVLSAHETTVIRTTTSAWATLGTDAPDVIAVDDQSADGRSSWHTDSAGLTTSSMTSCDGAGTCTTMVTAPDGSYTVGVTLAGRTMSQTRFDANAQTLSGTTLDYDPQGRPWHQTDLRAGVTTFGYDNGDQLRSVSHAGQTTGYDYDALGRKTLETQPDNGQVQTAYWPTGEIQSVGGVRTYPQSYTYDTQGRLKTLTTQGAVGAEVTTWNYDAQSGQMTGKAYADGKGPTYSYTPANRLATRTWARGIVTTYGYDNAGQLASITYSDGTTPPAAYAFDRLGRLTSASGGGSARALAYQGNTSLLASESYTAGPMAGVSVSTGYDGLLRRSSLQVAQGQNILVTQSFGFDAASRLASASEGTASAAYGYYPNSATNLVQSITFSNNANSGGTPQTVMTTTKSYDLLDRLTGISSTVVGASAPVSGYNYTYDAANERVRADVAADGTHWNYSYDALGQVTGASRQWSDGRAVSGQQFGYGYDLIGNRTGVTMNGRQSAYTSNALNQYNQRTVPGAVDVIGVAAADATVTLNQQPTLRQSGGYFAGTVTANNGQGAVDVPVSVAAVKPSAGIGSGNALATRQGNVFLPQTPEQFVYDADGNLTQDGHWIYTWDGENRLVSMEAISSLPVAEYKKLNFNYDSTGRRIQKQVWQWNVQSKVYEANSDTLFAYCDKALVAEMDGANDGSLQRTYMWGSGLDRGQQLVRNLGELLAVTNTVSSTETVTHFVSCDGSSNVVALVRAADEDASSRCEYGVYGEAIKMTGAMATLIPFRFSTYYVDVETNTYYVNFRYYSSTIGRWLSRDPIGEEGGTNTMTYVWNRPTSYVDPLGLAGVAEGWSNAVASLAGWMFGHQGGDTNYGPGSLQSQQMSQSYDASYLRGYFVRKNYGLPCRDWKNVSGVRCRYTIRLGFMNTGPMLDILNGTAEFVGSAAGSGTIISRDCIHSTITVKFELVNTTDLDSLLGGVFGPRINVTTPNLPFSNWTQTYDWTENFFCRCCN